MKHLKAFSTIILAFFFASCVSLTDRQQAYQGEIKEYKSPSKAMSLAFLPGVSNLYLASGKDRPSQTKEHMLGAAAIANWATWPVSILWAVPQAYIDAKRINIQESIYTNTVTHN